MLKGLFLVLMVYASKGILYLIYGKKGIQLREKDGKENSSIGFSFLAIFWFLCAFFLICGFGSFDFAEKIWLIVITLGIPMIIAIVATIKRKKIKSIFADTR